MNTLRQQALQVVLKPDPDRKSAEARLLDEYGCIGAEADLQEPAGVPGRPARPELVAHTAVKPRSMSTVEGRAALTHALAHIELNAIDLALDICWRFAGMPHDFYRKWLVVAKKEALQFELLRDHMHALGHAYGDFPAHRVLWEMAERTKHDPLTSRRRAGLVRNRQGARIVG